MDAFMLMLILLVVLALLAWLCGADSRETWDSEDFELRQQRLARH